VRALARELVLRAGESPEGVALEGHVLADRFRAAAWLARNSHAVLRRAGEVTFTIPTDAATPAWFRVAMEEFRRRQWWSVTRQTRAGIRSYVVRWLGHGTWRPKDVSREVLAPVG